MRFLTLTDVFDHECSQLTLSTTHTIDSFHSKVVHHILLEARDRHRELLRARGEGEATVDWTAALGQAGAVSAVVDGVGLGSVGDIWHVPADAD